MSETGRPQLVLDANILIDLQHGDLVEALFALPYQLLAPDLVLAELAAADAERLVQLGMTSVSLAGPQLADVLRLRATERGVSLNDLAALVGGAISRDHPAHRVSPAAAHGRAAEGPRARSALAAGRDAAAGNDPAGQGC